MFKKFLISPVSLFFILNIFITGCSSKGIKGNVKDPFGNGIDNVIVKIEDTIFKTKTNDKGEYSINYNSDEFIIIFTKKGYTTLKINFKTVKNQDVILNSTVMYPIPNEKGIYYIGERELIKLNDYKVEYRCYQVLTENHTEHHWLAPSKGNLIIRQGLASFIDMTQKKNEVIQIGNEYETYHYAHSSLLPHQRMYRNYKIRSKHRVSKELIQVIVCPLNVDCNQDNNFAYNGLKESNIQKIGTEEIIIKTIELKEDDYAWAEMEENGTTKKGYHYYPFRVSSTSQ